AVNAPWLVAILEHPARFLVVTFFLVGMVGAVLLTLPAATTRPGQIAFVDAVFTSFSATCVTGLAVLDTPHDFTLFGQAVILGLIQVGGLGIMVFSTAVLLLLGERLSIRQEGVAAEILGARQDQVGGVLRNVLLVTFGTELLGAVLLAALFVGQGDTVAMGVWRGLFTSVSAFCNAGFALQSDSLVPYQTNPWILHIVALVIILGGLGPMVVVQLPEWLRTRRIGLQSRLVIWTTLLLLLIPALLIALVEWSGTLASLSPTDKLTNAWFQSVTLRTAGFNSIDLAAVQPAVLTLMLGLMFKDGVPGGLAMAQIGCQRALAGRRQPGRQRHHRSGQPWAGYQHPRQDPERPMKQQ
ncbi:MAG: potassium transporter TrkG, partial [Myxococcota bacterium]